MSPEASTARARSCAGGLARQAPQWLGPACSKGKGKAQLSQQGEPRKSIFAQHSRQKRWFSLTITPQAGQRGGSAKSMSGTANVRKIFIRPCPISTPVAKSGGDRCCRKQDRKNDG